MISNDRYSLTIKLAMNGFVKTLLNHIFSQMCCCAENIIWNLSSRIPERLCLKLYLANALTPSAVLFTIIRYPGCFVCLRWQIWHQEYLLTGRWYNTLSLLPGCFWVIRQFHYTQATIFPYWINDEMYIWNMNIPGPFASGIVIYHDFNNYAF